MVVVLWRMFRSFPLFFDFETEPHYVNQVGLRHNSPLSSATQVLDGHRDMPGQVILYNTYLKETYLNLKHDSHDYFRQTDKILDIIHARNLLLIVLLFQFFLLIIMKGRGSKFL